MRISVIISYLAVCIFGSTAATAEPSECVYRPTPKSLEQQFEALGEADDFEGILDLALQHESENYPDVLWAIGIYYETGLKPERFRSDSDRNQYVVDIYWRAALCGLGQATGRLESIYKNGWLGLAKDLEVTTCLRGAVDADIPPRQCYHLAHD